MHNSDWKKELNVAITVCDQNGDIIEMNEKSQHTFQKYGGASLVGKSLFTCHSEKSVAIIKALMNDNRTNIYTIEKEGKKKLIYQCPWYENGEVMGLVELSMEIPFEMPHFVR
jgi:transcriptional regulator with PAS, ATPase and Fis domain